MKRGREDAEHAGVKPGPPAVNLNKTQAWDEKQAPPWVQPSKGVEHGSGEVSVDEMAATGPRSVAAIGELRAGDLLGQYEIIRLLGEGGMGVVYLARDNKLGRRVAIKLLHTQHPDLTRRFVVEAQTTARFTHENIVVIHEVGERNGSPFMVLEYLEGRPLADLRGTPQPVGRAVEMVAAVVRALIRAHEEGIIHRDLKPENIFLTNSGAIKVLDFGIAKVLEHPVEGEGPRSWLRGEQASSIAGTVAYMSPEQWGTGEEIDNRTDIWAVGVILTELISGINPFEGLELQQVRSLVTDIATPLPSLGSVAPRVPAELVVVVDRCLRKRKAERFENAAALLRALEPFLPGVSASPIRLELGPYAGLRSFQEEDAGRFFGRHQEIAAFAARLLDTPLMAVVGPSGIGKSSLMRAGVVPVLKASGSHWEVLIVRPGRDPMGSLARLLIPMLQPVAVPEDPSAHNEVRAKLILEPGYFGSVLRLACRNRKTRFLLLVDQFEELFTLEAQVVVRRAFTACLSGAADDATSPLRVVCTVRADFLGRVAEDPVFMSELTSGLYFLGPPSADGLRDALVRPAEIAGYRFETDTMVNEMIHYLEATPGGLPLLQFAASQLWDTRDPARKMLTEAAYRGLGGVAGALVSHADRVLTKLSPSLKALCRTLFVHLVTPERTRAVRNIDELKELVGASEDLDRLLDHLVDSRLVVTQSVEGGAAAEIVHESLITTWPTLRRWLDESQEDSVFLDQLLAAARQWNNNKRDRGLLWGGEMVTELQRFERRYKGRLPQITKDFSEAVSAYAASGARRKRALVSAGIAVLLSMLAAAAVALVVIRRSQLTAEENAQQARAAEAEAQTALAERIEAEKKQRELSERLKGTLAELQSAIAQSELRGEELEQRRVQLESALSQARSSQVVAQQAKERAEQSAGQLKVQREIAQTNFHQTQDLLVQEQRRVERLKGQLGSIIEELR